MHIKLLHSIKPIYDVLPQAIEQTTEILTNNEKSHQYNNALDNQGMKLLKQMKALLETIEEA